MTHLSIIEMCPVKVQFNLYITFSIQILITHFLYTIGNPLKNSDSNSFMYITHFNGLNTVGKLFMYLTG